MAEAEAEAEGAWPPQAVQAVEAESTHKLCQWHSFPCFPRFPLCFSA